MSFAFIGLPALARTCAAASRPLTFLALGGLAGFGALAPFLPLAAWALAAAISAAGLTSMLATCWAPGITPASPFWVASSRFWISALAALRLFSVAACPVFFAFLVLVVIVDSFWG